MVENESINFKFNIVVSIGNEIGTGNSSNCRHVIKESKFKFDSGSSCDSVEGKFHLIGDCIVVSAYNSSKVLEDEESSRCDGGCHWGTNLFFNDVLVDTLSGDSEEALLSNCENLTCQKSIVSWLAELIDVLGENISNKEHVGWVGIGSGNSVGINAVKSGVDLKG